MFRIRRIYDAITTANRELVVQVQAILRVQFPDIKEKTIQGLPDQLTNPLKHRFRCILFVAEDSGYVSGFALLLHAPDLNFCYLDFISAGQNKTSRGIGGALYERVREEAASLGCLGVLLECLPDDPALSPDTVIRQQNAARLRFYERYGARPIADTAYETPVTPGDADPPYLVYDRLGDKKNRLSKKQAQEIVRAILERKYANHCPPDYVDHVVQSIKDDPVKLRPPRYATKPGDHESKLHPRERRITLVVNDQHAIHHVNEKGYVESPVRISSIMSELKKLQIFEEQPITQFPISHIKAVHDSEYVEFLRKACANVPSGKSVYPYVFPIRNHARQPKSFPLRAGYYCIDTFTPLNENAYLAAIRAVDCTLTAAQSILDGAHMAYSLVRPPGHHAERSSFGGFCYLNSASVAANYFSAYGKVALLDVDYHHGNGSQDIFYDRKDVLTVSIHGNPRDSYPYFSGFADERGTGEGQGYNLNFPLPENIDGERYRETLTKACDRIRRFKPRFLVISLGLDTAKGDPTGSWSLLAKDFTLNGALLGELGLPTLVVQEGGYKTRTLGINARHFFKGLWESWRPLETRQLTAPGKHK
jgi:acetoin utilization deacetylase AcuC-like enzyme/GNAT superfamily N-acetyltransferase